MDSYVIYLKLTGFTQDLKAADCVNLSFDDLMEVYKPATSITVIHVDVN